MVDVARVMRIALALEPPTVVAVARALDALSVRWAIGGSLASAAHVEPRATNDVDVIAMLTENEARHLVGELGADFYADADAAADAARRRSSFNIIDNRSFLKNDVFVPGGGPLGAGQLDRLQMLEIFPGFRELPVLVAEDVVLQKLPWYRLGGGVSDRQWRDIVSVLRISGPAIDQGYLDEVASPEGLSELLERARADANDC